jgi:hypothetical protein
MISKHYFILTSLPNVEAFFHRFKLRVPTPLRAAMNMFVDEQSDYAYYTLKTELAHAIADLDNHPILKKALAPMIEKARETSIDYKIEELLNT